MSLGGKIVAGTFVVVALFLALTRPAGVAQVESASASAYATGVQALQGR